MKTNNSENNILNVITSFYMAEVLLKKENIDEGTNLVTLEKHLKEIKKKAEKLTKKQLLNYFFESWSQRYDNYMNSEWELKEISISDCGVWPKMGGLPAKFSQGSVQDTSKLVLDLIENKNRLTYRTSKVLYIEEIIKSSKLICEYIPPIVLEGGLIRNNKFRTSDDSKSYKKCKYDIDDGNHRIVALYLAGEEKVIAWVGKRIYKNSLLY